MGTGGTDLTAWDPNRLFKVGHRPPASKQAFEKAKTDKDVAAFGAVGQKAVPMPNIPAMGSVWADWGVAQARNYQRQGL